jgi:ketosteroid isomerase-like protein
MQSGGEGFCSLAVCGSAEPPRYCLAWKAAASESPRDTARAMSQENVEIVQRTYAAFERGDLGALLDDVHPEVVSWAHPRGDEGRYEGRDGVVRFITEWLEPFDEFTQVPEEFRDAGDKVLVRVFQRARGKESGVPVEGNFWLVHHLRDGKAFQVDLYDNEDEALEAAGLSE